jgi:putative transposase
VPLGTQLRIKNKYFVPKGTKHYTLNGFSINIPPLTGQKKIRGNNYGTNHQKGAFRHIIFIANHRIRTNQRAFRYAINYITMPNTYTQIYIQSVFAVQNRISLILPEWQDELYKYITGIVQNNGHKLIAINGMPDHLHLFIGMKPNQSLSDLMQDVKGDSSKWVHEKGFTKGKFEWQAGFSGFSYSLSQIDSVVKYINNQKVHHQKKTFIQEYLEFLKKFKVPFDERYIFKSIEF